MCVPNVTHFRRCFIIHICKGEFNLQMPIGSQWNSRLFSSLSAFLRKHSTRSAIMFVTFKGKTSLLMEKKEAMALVQDAMPATLPHTLLAVSML